MKFLLLFITCLLCHVVQATTPQGNDGAASPKQGLESGLSAAKSNTISVVMGQTTFSWELSAPVQHGTFLDGQPWIVVPAEGVKLLKATPTRLNQVTVQRRQEKVVSETKTTQADIDMTVINPPVGTYLGSDNHMVDEPAFGWDSRGTIRYAGEKKYAANLPWDGTTPYPLKAGDIVTTAKSLRENIADTCLEAVAVLTVLATPPPADAFRPGVIRSKERRENPEFICYKDIIDLSPYLIKTPTTDLLGKPVTVSQVFSGSKLMSLCPGPEILNCGLNDSRATHAVYNNNNANYGADVSMQSGDLAVGALASWLTLEERKACLIRFIQHAIDLYEAVNAKLSFSHNGGHMSGFGTQIIIAGKMLNHKGMLAFDKEVNGLAPSYYFSDYSQAFYLGDPAAPGPFAPAVDSPQFLALGEKGPELNQIVFNVESAGNGSLTLDSNTKWPAYRPAREIPNLRMRVISGTGAGETLYVVSDITHFVDAKTSEVVESSPKNEADAKIKGGTLLIKPEWKNGIPDKTSKVEFFLADSSQMNLWYFKAGGMDVSQKAGEPISFKTKNLSLSPTTDYGAVNVGAYVTLFIALHALKAESNYTGGINHWMIHASGTPGYGEALFNGARSRMTTRFAPKGSDLTEPLFIGALWKEQVLDPMGVRFAYTDGSTAALPIPPQNAKTSLEPIK